MDIIKTIETTSKRKMKVHIMKQINISKDNKLITITMSNNNILLKMKENTMMKKM